VNDMMTNARLFRRFVLLGLMLSILLCMPGSIPAGQTAGGEKATVSASGDAGLLGVGPQRVFDGEFLREVAFPLGGIGTGTVSLGGRGNLRDWEIFNRPGKGVNLPFTFFALYFEQNGKKSVRVLEGPLQPPFTTGFGFRREDVPGFPRMEKARFKGEYPFAEVELSDSQIPLAVTLEAFNPFIPLNPEDSGIPAVVLRYKVKNLGSAPARVTVAGSVLNPIGYDGEGQIGGLGNDKFGQNTNELRRTPTLRGLAMSSRKVKPEAPAFGTISLATPWNDITYLTHWVRGEWWDDLQIFWDDFAADGRLKDLDEVSPSPDKRSDVGTLGISRTSSTTSTSSASSGAASSRTTTPRPSRMPGTPPSTFRRTWSAWKRKAVPSMTPSSPRPFPRTSWTPSRVRRRRFARPPASVSGTGTSSPSRAAATSPDAVRSIARTSGIMRSRWPSSFPRSSGRCARPTSSTTSSPTEP
jgi:hypothetical protein